MSTALLDFGLHNRSMKHPLAHKGQWFVPPQHRVQWDSARVLCADIATKRPDFVGLETGLSGQTFTHLQKASTGLNDRSRSAFSAALGGVWHKVKTNSAFAVGDLCVKCKEEVEDLSHIMFRCLHAGNST
eukprot:2118120-Amphidinium_carterae.1